MYIQDVWDFIKQVGIFFLMKIVWQRLFYFF